MYLTPEEQRELSEIRERLELRRRESFAPPPGWKPSLLAWLRAQPLPRHGGERLGREIVERVLSGAHARTCEWFEGAGG